MAGMLPGVEAARRRRFHQSSRNPMNNQSYGSDNSAAFSRRPSICSLYAPTTTHDSTSNAIHPPSSKYSSMRNDYMSAQQITNNQSEDENRLGAAAREAKRRLDERLQQYNHRRPQTKSSASERERNQQQVQKTRKNKKDKKNVLRWLRLRNSRKTSSSDEDEEECVVCLEEMVATPGNRVTQLQCGHRFHGKCLLPWLETSSHCPCCRLQIINSPP